MLDKGIIAQDYGILKTYEEKGACNGNIRRYRVYNVE